MCHHCPFPRALIRAGIRVRACLVLTLAAGRERLKNRISRDSDSSGSKAAHDRKVLLWRSPARNLCALGVILSKQMTRLKGYELKL